MTLIEDSIRSYWAEYPQPTRSEIIDLVVSLVDKIVIVSNKKFIRDKLGRLLKELVVREWPQRFANLNYILISLWNSTTSNELVIRREFVCLVLKYIAEDTFEFVSQVTSKRREDLRNGLIVLMGNSELIKRFAFGLGLF
jgi:hypothetical protein